MNDDEGDGRTAEDVVLGGVVVTEEGEERFSPAEVSREDVRRIEGDTKEDELVDPGARM